MILYFCDSCLALIDTYISKSMLSIPLDDLSNVSDQENNNEDNDDDDDDDNNNEDDNKDSKFMNDNSNMENLKSKTRERTSKNGVARFPLCKLM